MGRGEAGVVGALFARPPHHHPTHPPQLQLDAAPTAPPASDAAVAAARAEAAAAAADAAAARRAASLAAADAEAARIAAAGGGPPLDRHTPWEPLPEWDVGDPELAALLRRVAVGGEVLAAVSDGRLAGPGGMLTTWATTVVRANVSNALVIALDDVAAAAASAAGVAAWRVDAPLPASQAAAGANHATSSLKFGLVARILSLGYAVLLSDVDIITFSNPFDPSSGLARDADVAAMSDGFDPPTAYGYDDVHDDAGMGWARYAHSTRVFALNSGLFYARPTPAGLDLMQRVAHRCATEAGWDQALFNEEALRPASPLRAPTPTSVRILALDRFMNSKVLFTRVRHEVASAVRDAASAGAGAGDATPSSSPFPPAPPTMLHVNYHPDKHPRMLAALAWYGGDAGALDAFPDGSE